MVEKTEKIDKGERETDTVFESNPVSAFLLVENESRRITSKGQKSEGRNDAKESNGNSKTGGHDLQKARNRVVFEFGIKLGCIKVSLLKSIIVYKIKKSKFEG